MSGMHRGEVSPSRNVSQQGSTQRIATRTWIAGRIQTLLSHYFQPDNPLEVQEAAVGDWVRQLDGLSQKSIEQACQTYLRDQPRRRPTPGDIRRRCREERPTQGSEGNRADLTPDELALLDGKIIPTARRWLDIPGLRDQGKRTLAYWGEV